MLRVVLAVVLAAALLGTAAPAVEDARAARTATLVEVELTRFGEAARELAADEEVAPRGAEARRAVTVRIPDGVAAAPVDYVALGGVPDGTAVRDTESSDVVAYRLAGRDRRVLGVPVDLRIDDQDGAFRDDEAALVVDDDAELVLSLVGRRDGPTVAVERSPPAAADERASPPDDPRGGPTPAATLPGVRRRA